MRTLEAHIYLVDDDPAVLKSLSRLLRSAGYEPEIFLSAREFMKKYDPDVPGCLVLDLAMPEVNGLELQQWLKRSNSPLPVIFLTGHGSVPASVQAMKEGAFDFLMKPVMGASFVKAIEQALLKDSEVRRAQAETTAVLARLAALTPREREVLERVVCGKLNKEIAAELGNAEKTIKIHRARIMEKMGVDSLAELARVAERIGIGIGGAVPPTTLPSLNRIYPS
jgi:FixJ family two-component response regulator